MTLDKILRDQERPKATMAPEDPTKYSKNSDWIHLLNPVAHKVAQGLNWERHRELKRLILLHNPKQ